MEKIKYPGLEQQKPPIKFIEEITKLKQEYNPRQYRIDHQCKSDDFKLADPAHLKHGQANRHFRKDPVGL